MQGNYIKGDNIYYLVTQQELWEGCRSEEEYFRILRERQRKEKPVSEPVFRIPDAEPGIIPGAL